MADLKKQDDHDSPPPREHHYLSVHRLLRDRVLTGPLDFFQKLQEESGTDNLEMRWMLWGLPLGPQGSVSPDGLKIFPTIKWNGCSFIIIQFPKPERMPEAYFAAIALWEDTGLRRYFTLELTKDELGGTLGGVLCEWRGDEHINYRTVIPPDKDAFFDAIREIVIVEQSRDLIGEYRQTMDSDEITFYGSLPEQAQAVQARLWLYGQYSARVEKAGREGGWAAAEAEFNRLLAEDPRLQPLQIQRLPETDSWIVVHLDRSARRLGADAVADDPAQAPGPVRAISSGTGTRDEENRAMTSDHNQEIEVRGQDTTKSKPEPMAPEDHVGNEILSLTYLRPQLSAKEVVALRRYAWRRAAFPRPDSELSTAEAAWRVLFFACDAQLQQFFPAETKMQIDSSDKAAQDLKLAERMMALRIKNEPKERPIGAMLFYATLILISFFGWAVFRSFWIGAGVGVTAACLVAFVSSTVFRDTWSSTRVAMWLNKAGRLFRSQQITDAAARIMENVLHVHEYDKTGNPHRVAEAVKAVEDALKAQETAIATAVGVFHSEPYKEMLRPVEDQMVRNEVSPEQRLRYAEYVVKAVAGWEEKLVGPLDQANEAAEEELFEAERQISGVPQGKRKDKLLKWLASAKQEYLKGRIATNITRNWFEFDASIAQVIAEHHGRLDVTFKAGDVADKGAQIALLPEVKRERDELRSQREALTREFFGILG